MFIRFFSLPRLYDIFLHHRDTVQYAGDRKRYHKSSQGDCRHGYRRIQRNALEMSDIQFKLQCIQLKKRIMVE